MAVLFKNDDLIPLEAFTTFGCNAKPNSDNPIGYFGTGLKYAVAVILRLEGTVRLFRGTEEFVFYTSEKDFRGSNFAMVRMKRRKGLFSRWNYSALPFTTELGKNWEPWMAVRELESNTRDENGRSDFIDDEIPEGMSFLNEFSGIDGHTHIIVECPKFEQAYIDLDKIFMPEKKLLHEIGHIQIYEGESNYIFFRGLRVTDLSNPSKFTYNLTTGITLTEDRTSKYPYSDTCAIMYAWMGMNDANLLEEILDIDEEKNFEGSFPFDQSVYMGGTSTSFIASIGNRVASGGTVPKRIRSFYDSYRAETSPPTTIKIEIERSEARDLLECDIPDSVKDKIRRELDK